MNTCFVLITDADKGSSTQRPSCAISGCRCLCRKSVSVALFMSGDATFSRVTFKWKFQKKKKKTLKSQIKRLTSRHYLSPVWPHWVEERSLGVTPQEALLAFVLLILITGLILFGERGVCPSTTQRALRPPVGRTSYHTGTKLSAGLYTVCSACPEFADFIAVIADALLAAQLIRGVCI